jgi:hypothetical protein
VYICYDIKGIQRHIFSSTRLKTIIGASAQIAQYDLDSHAEFPDQCIFAGGGRGAFHFSKQALDQLDAAKSWLVQRAHQDGLDIEVGVADSFESAALRRASLFPFLPGPDSLAGFPCSESGLFPVKKPTACHDIVKRRAQLGQGDSLGGQLIDQHLRGMLPPELQDKYLLAFLRNVSPEPWLPGEDDSDAMEEGEVSFDDQAIARAGQCSLGNRNRWAIVAMDGNDIGKQFRHCTSTPSDESGQMSTLRTACNILKRSLTCAFHRALSECIVDWYHSLNTTPGRVQECCYYDGSSCPKLVVPFRPLILGGDDLVIICHCSHALSLVRKLTAYFEENTRQFGEEQNYPWPATGGRLTISSGILFTNTSIPLHTAIAYAESLVASAKGRYRDWGGALQPSPAAVDWDTLTDSMIDTPFARRRRELLFMDHEIGRVVSLTRRPYLLSKGDGKATGAPFLAELDALMHQLADGVPNSFRSLLRRNLACNWSSRMRFRFSISKDGRYRDLAKQLDEEHFDDLTKLGSAWRQAWEPATTGRRPAQDTAIIDAISLLDEEHRSGQDTGHERASLR